MSTSGLKRLLGSTSLKTSGEAPIVPVSPTREEKFGDHPQEPPVPLQTSGCLPTNDELLTRGGKLSGTRKLIPRGRIAEKQEGLSFLESNAVTPQTAKSYFKYLQDFKTFVADAGGSVKTLSDAENMQDWLLDYLDSLFVKGYGPDTGSYVLAAVMNFYPQFAKAAGPSLPRVRRALAGWGRLEPPQSRWPVPWPLIALAAVRFVGRGQPILGLAVVMATIAYLRPAALLGLRVRHLLRPLPGVDGPAGACYSLLVADRETGVPSKTNTFDDSVLLDRPDLMWMNKWWETLVRDREPDDFLFPMTQVEYALAIKQEFLGLHAEKLGVVSYSLRHAGPSWDFLMKFRTLAEIQARGHWRAPSSVTRYQKSSKISAAWEKLPQVVRERAVEAATHFETLLSNPVSNCNLGEPLVCSSNSSGVETSWPVLCDTLASPPAPLIAGTAGISHPSTPSSSGSLLKRSSLAEFALCGSTRQKKR